MCVFVYSTSWKVSVSSFVSALLVKFLPILINIQSSLGVSCVFDEFGIQNSCENISYPFQSNKSLYTLYNMHCLCVSFNKCVYLYICWTLEPILSIDIAFSWNKPTFYMCVYCSTLSGVWCDIRDAHCGEVRCVFWTWGWDVEFGLLCYHLPFTATLPAWDRVVQRWYVCEKIISHDKKLM